MDGQADCLGRVDSTNWYQAAIVTPSHLAVAALKWWPGIAECGMMAEAGKLSNSFQKQWEQIEIPGTGDW